MKTYAFYGVSDRYFKLDDTVFEAIEDEDDGYRSYLQSIVKVEKVAATFSRVKLADVYVIKADSKSDERYDRLIDATDGHIWLSIGTNYTEDYYPYFVFHYNPKSPA